MNKGLEILEKKKEKNRNKMFILKDSQKNIEREVVVSYPIFKRINGKQKFDKIVEKEGIQKENKVYFDDGKYIFINKKGVKIIKKGLLKK